MGLAALLAGCSDGVDERRLRRADREPGAWLTNGRTWGEQRFSPLDEITSANVDALGLAWEASLDSFDFGIEATPLVADGRLYVTSTWSRVFAFDAATGKRLWAYDPDVPRDWLAQGCCKAVNRGVALWRDKVYVGAFDGRLIALHARTGKPVWTADTTGRRPLYTITGAPRVVKGKVIIGNGGGDFGTRGYISAYDAETGKLAWRFYITPRDPRLGQEHPELEAALKTWDPNRDWSVGGGGNAWDSMSYDPELDLLYVGTGNGGPYDPRRRNPGGGDSLYLSSILALRPDTGRLVWRYQTTPGDQWDFTATANMVLADLEIGGARRQVLMQAPKNGFFYVLDRRTGELLSAEKYVRTTWAERVDLDTGRPVLAPGADYTKGRTRLHPSPYGGHNWQPMAFSPRTGLVYIPAQDLGWIWDPDAPTWFEREVGGDTPARASSANTGRLIAWDPRAGRPAWVAELSEPMNGGVLVTGGGLVVQGLADGHIEFRDAASGRRLRRLLVGTGIVAPPVSYRVGREQFIAVAAGWNGVRVDADSPGAPPGYDNAGRLLVLKLGGGPIRVAPRRPARPPLMSVAEPQSPAAAARGQALYVTHCARCHGYVGETTPFPDLRRMTPETLAAFDDIVLGGAYRQAGMASFANVLSSGDTGALRAFLISWAQRTRSAEAPAASRAP
ncbi:MULTISPECIES: PQQ-dependent dehydrogenase, methanol/ethanol family [unclassified Phenylobacterium]|uniref:PQQ-dependent dehydrogenase, methanol/ethanol family n=1 Tax=unclassified Phenylobacterium TaxID=2640670 RepID=UPI000A3FF793|nr:MULTISPECIES: PQQ-dependent dehydrogenase, methanol/ethanol family [unclassified Phenylobacterium]